MVQILGKKKVLVEDIIKDHEDNPRWTHLKVGRKEDCPYRCTIEYHSRCVDCRYLYEKDVRGYRT